MTNIWSPICRKRICIIQSTDDPKNKLMNCTRCATKFVFAKLNVQKMNGDLLLLSIFVWFFLFSPLILYVLFKIINFVFPYIVNRYDIRDTPHLENKK